MPTLFTGGSVFDGHRHLPDHGLLVDDGKVVAVLRPAALETLDQPADVVDLAGGLVSPGFTDAHCHPIQGGLERMQCDLTDGSTREEYLAMVRGVRRPVRRAVDHRRRLGDGGVPGRHALGGRPRRSGRRTGRSCSTTVTTTAPGPTRGRSSSRGSPPRPPTRRTGGSSGSRTAARRARCTRVPWTAWPRSSPSCRRRSTPRGCSRARSTSSPWASRPGRTRSWAPTRGWPTPVRRTSMRSRVATWSPTWSARSGGTASSASTRSPTSWSVAGRSRAAGIAPTSIKIMQDGVCENFTAAMLSPYLDGRGHSTGNAGHSFVAADELKEVVVALAAEGFQVHVHAIGDRGTREALDAFAAARDAGHSADLRHHIAHIQVVHPDDVPRFAELGVAANAQALWACHEPQMDELTIPFLGDERATWQYPFGGLHRAGARLVMGSDWPVTSPDPIAAIHTAVTRTAYDDPRAPLLPEQARRPDDRVRGVHRRIGVGERPRPDRWRRCARAGERRRPGRPRPRPVRRAGRRDRRRPDRLDVGQQGARCLRAGRTVAVRRPRRRSLNRGAGPRSPCGA